MAQEFLFLSHFFRKLRQSPLFRLCSHPGAAIGPGPSGCKPDQVGVGLSGHANEGIAILMTSATEP
jgi:hypothetical protein